MPFHFSIASFVLATGATVQVPPNGVVLVVGPNNSGKSQLLRELYDSAVGVQGGSKPVVTRESTLSVEGDSHEFATWLRSHYQLREPAAGFSVEGAGLSVGTSESFVSVVERCWLKRTDLGLFAHAAVARLGAEARLREADAVPAFDAGTEAPSQSVHILYDRLDLEHELSGAFREAFGTDLVLDRLGGSHLSLRVGPRPDTRVVGGELSVGYARALRAYPKVQDQGDGMRSFVGCLLHLEVGARRVLLVDEPEAFLHPPQARALGMQFSKSARTDGRQFVVATHSSDFVRGVLDGSDTPVTVVRLTRDERGTVACVVAADTIRELWSNPLLRASNLLDALFHERLVLCESDGDCRFYNAVIEAMAEADGCPRPDVMFAHTGGKDRLHIAAEAMRAAGVAVDVIADLDVLGTPDTLCRIWTALGQDPAWATQLQRRVAAAVQATALSPARGDVLHEVRALLAAGSPSSPITRDETTKIRGVLRSTGGWSGLKAAGEIGIGRGQALADLRALRELLARGGLHVVPVGELEGFLPELGRHGPAWVARALRVDLGRSPDAAAARAFMGSLALHAPRTAVQISPSFSSSGSHGSETG